MEKDESIFDWPEALLRQADEEGVEWGPEWDTVPDPDPPSTDVPWRMGHRADW